MNVLAAEWVAKAETDYESASILEQSGRSVYDQVCNLAQQCAEKYLKAYLQEHNIPFRKTHELDELLKLCLTIDQTLAALQSHLTNLTQYAVDYRYPGVWANSARAQTAFQDVTDIRTLMRRKLGLPPALFPAN